MVKLLHGKANPSRFAKRAKRLQPRERIYSREKSVARAR